jgi:exosortase A-associated hydrolase 2
MATLMPEVFFLPAAVGQRLCVYFPARGELRGRMLFVHALGEEMNKSRRMVSLQARLLADAGYAVLLLDLLGCGDSSGDFADATWAAWIDDITLACGWLRREADAPLWLWGMRAGALLAADAASRLDEDCGFLFWQPAATGRVLLQQFLRLKAASDLGEGRAAAVMADLRRRLGDGESIDIAGYTLSAQLAHGLERAQLAPPPRARRVEWIEVSARSDAQLTPAAVKAIDAWRNAGCAVRGRVVNGPAFWQTIDIEDAPALLATTLEAMDAHEAVTP